MEKPKFCDSNIILALGNIKLFDSDLKKEERKRLIAKTLPLLTEQDINEISEMIDKINDLNKDSADEN